MHHPTDRIAHTTAFVTPVVEFVIQVMEHWLERQIAQWVHHEELIRRPITPWVDSLPHSYISLPITECIPRTVCLNRTSKVIFKKLTTHSIHLYCWLYWQKIVLLKTKSVLTDRDWSKTDCTSVRYLYHWAVEAPFQTRKKGNVLFNDTLNTFYA